MASDINELYLYQACVKTVLRKKTFYITPEIDKMLKIAAAEDDLNFSQVVELALKEYLERRKKAKK
jgi:hypothetical protein